MCLLDLSTGRDYLDGLPFLTTKVKTGKAEVELMVQDMYPGWEIKLDRDQILSLLEETGFLREGRYVLDDKTIQEYQPRRIVLIFEQMPEDRPQLMQLFMEQGRDICGYDRQIRAEEYEINFYLDKEYFDGLKAEEVASKVESLTIKVVLYLGKLHQKQNRLSAEEKQIVYQRLPALLQKYDFIDIEAP